MPDNVVAVKSLFALSSNLLKIEDAALVDSCCEITDFTNETKLMLPQKTRQ